MLRAQLCSSTGRGSDNSCSTMIDRSGIIDRGNRRIRTSLKHVGSSMETEGWLRNSPDRGTARGHNNKLTYTSVADIQADMQQRGLHLRALPMPAQANGQSKQYMHTPYTAHIGARTDTPARKHTRTCMTNHTPPTTCRGCSSTADPQGAGLEG